MPDNKLSVKNLAGGNLSPHFTFRELAVTSKSKYQPINTLFARDYIGNLTLLANYILEPARKILNRPLIITSAYRCPALNREIGGSRTSQHLNGTAADFKFNTKDLTLQDAFIKLKESPLHFGQLILEKSWLHISLGVPFRPLNKCYESFKIV